MSLVTELAAELERDRPEILVCDAAEGYNPVHPVADWTAIGDGGQPLYERYGEERVAAGHYATVIRRREHLLPLRDALLAAVEKRSCAF